MIEILMPSDSNGSFVPPEKMQQTGRQKNGHLPTILVVDDERLVADTLTEILEGAGYSVFTAYDGWEALEIANKHRPELLLTDVVMPRMNGVELAIAMRKMRPSTVVLLFSGNAGVSDILAEGRKQGFEFDVLGKPIHPDALLSHLSKLR